MKWKYQTVIENSFCFCTWNSLYQFWCPYFQEECARKRLLGGKL